MAAREEISEHGHQIGRVRIVPKPWGHELIFADVPGCFTGKELHVRGGQSLSLQYHEHKEEVIAVREGRIMVEVGPTAESLEQVVLSVGDSIHISPGTVHRTNAVDDSVLLEASTYFPDDVIRLNDKYGREGTSAA